MLKCLNGIQYLTNYIYFLPAYHPPYELITCLQYLIFNGSNWIQIVELKTYWKRTVNNVSGYFKKIRVLKERGNRIWFVALVKQPISILNIWKREICKVYSFSPAGPSKKGLPGPAPSKKARLPEFLPAPAPYNFINSLPAPKRCIWQSLQ